MTSPTQRTVKFLRERGWLAGITETWNPYARIRQDLFGFVDIVAVKRQRVLFIQTTTTDNAAARKEKIATLPAFPRFPNLSVVVLSWAKRGGRGERKVWTPKAEYYERVGIVSAGMEGGLSRGFAVRTGPGRGWITADITDLFGEVEEAE